jgi:hypothetical protein
LAASAGAGFSPEGAFMTGGTLLTGRATIGAGASAEELLVGPSACPIATMATAGTQYSHDIAGSKTPHAC